MDERTREILRSLPNPPRVIIHPPRVDPPSRPFRRKTPAGYDSSSLPFKLPYSLMIDDDTRVVEEQFNQTLWQELAGAALQHYHETQGVKMVLFGKVSARLLFQGDKCCYHLNFQAKPDDGTESSPKLIFAEVFRSLKSDVRVTFCGIMDSSNRELLKGCCHCSKKVLHPQGVKFFEFAKAFASGSPLHLVETGTIAKDKGSRCLSFALPNDLPTDEELCQKYKDIWKLKKKMDERTREILRSLPHPPREIIRPPRVDPPSRPFRRKTPAGYDSSSLPFKLPYSLMIDNDTRVVQEQFNQTLWQELAGAALQHYHETQGIKMELFGEVSARLVFQGDKCCYHLNFQAKHDDGTESSPKLIFAEVFRSLKSEVRVTFCGVMDPSNPELLKGCRHCSKKVLHPQGVKFFKFAKAFASGSTIS